MNTPPKMKRYTYTPNSFQHLGGTYHSGLFDEKFSKLLAQVASSFSHLEGGMAKVLALLMGLDDTQIDTAGYILRSIISPKARGDMMKDLLELSPRNLDLGSEHDEVLKEFAALAKLRNDFVHGLWFTKETGEVLLATEDEHGWGLIAAQPADSKKMEDTVKRIWDLYRKILKTVGPALQKRRLAQESHQPSEAPKT